MISYADRMRRHLACYKRECLGVEEDGIWRRNGRKYSHILPNELHRLNILETIRREFWLYHAAHHAMLALHTDFHHLNSSQAFAFNLFFPFFGLGPSSTPEPMLTELGAGARELRSWSFEAVPDRAEGTTFDFAAQLEGGARVLVEVKLTESGFGRCSPTESHRRKLQKVYAPRLRDKVAEGGLEEDAFFLNYQLFRNVSHLDLGRRDGLVLLVPRANETAWSEAESFLRTLLVSRAREAVCLVAAEDLWEALMLRSTSVQPLARMHLEMLGEKYLITPSC
jgi:hypothetical protein